MRLIKKIGCFFKIGTMVHGLTEIITFGNAYAVSYRIAKLFGKESCGCYERELWLNCLTCKEECDG